MAMQLLARLRRPTRWGQVLALAGLALMPKCPLCLLALLGMLGVVEGSAWAARVASFPLLQGFAALVLALVVLALARRHGWRLALGAGAVAGLLWAFKFVLGSPVLVGVAASALGVVVLMGRLQAAPASAGVPLDDGRLDAGPPVSRCGCGEARKPEA